jgi:hypothetical protein
MRLLASLVVSFLVLLAYISSVSATPFSYTISALESWSFSGIPVEVTFPYGGGIIDTGVCTQGDTICHPFNLPGTGSQAASADITHVSASTTLIAPGSATLVVPFVYGVRALETGWSTLTFNYQLQETANVPAGGVLSARAGIGAFSQGYGIQQLVQGGATAIAHQFQTTTTADQSLVMTRTLTGIITGSAFIEAGSFTTFQANAFSQAFYSVPLPDTFWLCLAGLAALTICMERRKLFAVWM